MKGQKLKRNILILSSTLSGFLFTVLLVMLIFDFNHSTFKLSKLNKYIKNEDNYLSVSKYYNLEIKTTEDTLKINITNDTENKLEIKKNKYENIFTKSNNINSINNTKLNNKPKNILMPIKHHALKKKSNSTENIFYKNKSRNLLNTNDTFLPLDSRTQIDENNKGTFSLGINFKEERKKFQKTSIFLLYSSVFNNSSKKT